MLNKDDILDTWSSFASEKSSLQEKVRKYDLFRYIQENSNISSAAKRRVEAELRKKKVKNKFSV